MEIEKFIYQSEGEWNSMRSGHSLAFKQFEEILSHIKITSLKINNPKVLKFLKNSPYSNRDPVVPFEICWSAETDWIKDNIQSKNELNGSCILIPLKETNKKGIILGSTGYAEKVGAISNYCFLEDGTFISTTKYKETVAEERIWFINKNLRCRSSVVYISNSKAVLQTSFASEVRRINL